jgi:PAS domain S-box-containing protein
MGVMGECWWNGNGLGAPELELIYRTAPIGLAFLSTDCRYIMINERLTEICGISVGDHIGRSVRETVPQVAEQVEQIVQTVLRTGESITGIEVRGQRPDRSNLDRVWITHWHPSKDRSGNIFGINVAAEEITDRKRAEADLSASQDRLRNLNDILTERVEAQVQERDRIWNLSQDLLVVSDSIGKILDINPAWSMLGWSREDLVGNKAPWLVHPDDRTRSLAERANVVAGQRTLHFENRILSKDGSYRWLSWFAVVDSGLIYASGRDVTKRKESQQQVQTLRRQLAEASHQTTIEAMAASIAHEIKQPLGAIVTNARAGLRWLGNSDPDLAEARAAFNRILDAGSRTNVVIEGVRALFGKQSRETSRINVRKLISDVLALVQGELESHHIGLHTDLADDLPEVTASRVQFQQVILNLITNAIDAMSSVSGRDRSLAIVARFDQQTSMVITIEDAGTGIDPVHLDHIFDPFFTTKSNGMGLGLAISRSIVEAHGGRLWAAPRSPYGTAFCVQVPAHFEKDLAIGDSAQS